MAQDFYSLTGAGAVTVPANTVVASTGIILAGNPKIIGTDFNGLIDSGDWIIDIANLERRRVKSIVSDTELILFKAFTNATGSAVLIVVKEDESAAVYMELTAVGDVTIDGVTVADGGIIPFGNKNDSGAPSKLIRPRIVNPGANAILVNIEYNNNNFAV